MSRLFIGEIGRVVEYDPELLTECDWRAIEECPAESRRTERYAWRALMRRSLRRMGYDESVAEADVVYDSMGAPTLEASGIYIGVSHTRTKVAVAISDAPCAVDIEELARNFRAIERRLIDSNEKELLAPYEFALPMAWAAKETLYKLSGVEGLNLISDMRIEAIDDAARTIACRASRGRFAAQTLTFNYTFDDDHVVVWRL